MARSRRVEIRLTPEQFTRLQAIMAQRGFASIAGFLRYVAFRQDVMVERLVFQTGSQGA